MTVARFRLALTCVLLSLGILLLLASIAVWFRYKIQIPVLDTALLLPLVSSGIHEGWGSISLHEWLAPISANTHRIAVTRILMLLDYQFLDGRNYTLYLSAWLGIALLVFLYGRAAGMQASRDRAGGWLVTGLALIYLCGPPQYLNLVNPVNASWYVAFACGAASAWLVIAYGRRPGYAWLLPACALAVVAALSNFAGVVACMLLAVLALHQRSRSGVLFALFAVVLVYVFFTGFEWSQPTVSGSGAIERVRGAGHKAVARVAVQLGSPAAWPGLLRDIVSSVGLQLGAPLSVAYPLTASLAVWCSALAIGWWWLQLLARWCSRREPGPRSEEFFLAMATICLGVSCAIPLARIAFTNPLSVRYQTITAVYWLSVSCLLLCKAQGLRNRPRLSGALVLLGCLPVLPVLLAVKSGLNSPASYLSNQASATQILGRLGVFSAGDQGLAWLLRNNPYLVGHQEFLKAYGFRSLEAQPAHLDVEQSACRGFWLDAVASEWPGVQEIRLRPAGISRNPFLDRIDVRGRDGEPGQLFAESPKVGAPRSVFFDRRTWRGYYRGDTVRSGPITLYVDPLIGSRYRCTLIERGS